ncbi:abscisic acid-deficient protein Aba4 family protein [Rhabdaerophilum sp. SD176]|uniref:abscisic acid-deficient protein Aba4 family protein n=1 Tax=Rhabdaerophilum sp. SD176 TaxID=2983548 RepID=UPI0024E03593|nr:abscisic acid-deficient protein Aba4 family protein [Rhabdaerophilum sp. SD176]
MSPDLLFGHAGTLALTGWVVLILGPRQGAFWQALPAWCIPALLSALYGGLALAHFAPTGGGYGSLAAVRQLLSSDWALLAGWVHYLAFDLVIGAMLARRLDAIGLARWLQAPLLFLVFLFGPIGFLLALLTELFLRAPARLASGKAAA